ncbi:MAG: hypothetical protein Ct9H300mP11_31750 [Chloroflexota bacterium]|nr:MAG: hypothetical protein Ct9H300mP11_31750 [Chloroflexota bacterium]
MARKIAVDIPAGVESGMQVRLTGEGDAGSEGGGSGNLYVYIDVQEHQYFDREGSDLTYVLPVNIAEAALGAQKTVPHPGWGPGRSQASTRHPTRYRIPNQRKRCPAPPQQSAWRLENNYRRQSPGIPG